MPTYRVQHAFQGFAGGSRDMFVNTFYVFNAETVVGTADSTQDNEGAILANCIRGFYSDSAYNNQALKYFMSDRCTGVGRTIKIYDMAAAPETPPVWSVTDTVAPWTTTSAASLPEEVAVCLSYDAINSGGNRPRRRGRIYIGPLNIGAINSQTSSWEPATVDDDLVQTLLMAGQGLKTQLLTQGGWEWRVFSQMDGLGFNIVQLSADNLFDTIRGRGNENGARSVRVLT